MTRAVHIPLALLAAAAALAALLVVALPAADAQAARCKKASKPAYEVANKRARKATLCLINKERRARGISRLRTNRAQRKAAKRHTKVMLRTGCFDHVCPGERDLAGRLSATDYLPCNCAWGVAENIAYGFGKRSSPRAIVKAWMGSSGHRANILNRGYEHIGIGVRKGAPTGSGGDAATYTTNFGYRN